MSTWEADLRAAAQRSAEAEEACERDPGSSRLSVRRLTARRDLLAVARRAPKPDPQAEQREERRDFNFAL